MISQPVTQRNRVDPIWVGRYAPGHRRDESIPPVKAAGSGPL